MDYIYCPEVCSGQLIDVPSANGRCRQDQETQGRVETHTTAGGRGSGLWFKAELEQHRDRPPREHLRESPGRHRAGVEVQSSRFAEMMACRSSPRFKSPWGETRAL